ncbi:MAG: hypothetical protein EBR10_08670 [Planctomycetes bacterium]|nr:hypothetical protein [Planctomycetota bacterium]
MFAPLALLAVAAVAPGADAASGGVMREMGAWLAGNGALAIFVAFILCGIGLHLSEDFILIPAGIMTVDAATGNVAWPLFFEYGMAAWAGIILGDIGWVWICRHFGARILGSRWFLRLVGPRTLLEMKYEVDRRGAWALLAARFIPGARTPMITVCGLMHLSWWKVLAVEMSGVVITAPLQMLIGVGVAKLGRQFESDAHRWMLYIGATLAVVLVMFILHLVIARRAKNASKPRAKVTWLETLRGTPSMRRVPRPSPQDR